MRSDLVDIYVTAIHMTDAAILVTADGVKQTWLPFSRIELHHRGKPNEYVATMPERLAMEKELI